MKNNNNFYRKFYDYEEIRINKWSA
jgi:hypothetical protein